MSKIKFTGTINWIKSNYDNEKKEFVRAAGEVSNKSKKIIQENTDYLRDGYKKSNIVSLSDQDWIKMRNTDSWKTDTLPKVIAQIKKNEAKNKTRDWEAILNGFELGREYAPIAYRREDKILVLIAGNTRLMVCKAYDIKPKIFIIDTDW